MLRAILTAAGEPFAIREEPDPSPGPGEALVAVRAAALNHRDVWITKGLYPGITWPCTPGSDAAGEVLAVGAGVDRDWVGADVVIDPALDWGGDERVQSGEFSILGVPRPGTLATHVCVPATQLHRRPPHLDAEQAAALPLAGLTAWRALVARGGVHAGETVLVSGIGGGVATLAMQFALALGCRVLVTSSSTEKRQRARELGAAEAFDYRADGWDERLRKAHGGVDLVIDGAAGPSMNAHISACRPGARIVIYGGTAGLPEGLNVRALFWKQLDIRGSTMGSPSDFAAMLAFVSEHRIVPLIDRSYPLAEVDEACARMDAGEQLGKILVIPEP